MLSVFIYWLAIRVYASSVAIASLFNPKAKLFVKGRRGLLNQIRYALINETRPRIWMHCASLGEFEQGRPLLERLRKEYNSHAIVLTFFSPSGYEVRKNYEGADYVFYLPLDSAYNAAKFIRLVQPKLCLFVKYDLWYFMLMKIAKVGTPLILISAIFRKDQPFFKWYGRLHRRMLHAFTHIFVQDAMSMQLLERAGVEHVNIGGDTRFDRVVEA
ncbi:MAG: 3-deoxy-D-manno-octulosonic acid transferase, partial [Chitinophagaceae bacterium]|nr:3-deoxy-D-manno-octulosonic acid transferase [Chitinophagaceae bacterium]